MGRIRVAKTNGDILTDAPKDLAFDSSQECLVIVNERIDSFTTVDGDGGHITSIAHGLGYRPTIKCYQEQLYDLAGNPIAGGLWSKGLSLLNIWADSTNINYQLYDAYGTVETYRIKTVIIANSQNGVVAGTLSNANGRLQVAKAGYDLNNITDLRQVAFSSKKGVQLINEKKSIVVHHNGTPDSSATATYAHGLGYIPQFDAVLVEYGAVLPYAIYGGAGINLFLDIYVDATNFTCSVYDAGGFLGGATDFTFRVHILCGKIE